MRNNNLPVLKSTVEQPDTVQGEVSDDQQAEPEDDNPRKLLVPKYAMGLIIGTAGFRINKIRETTGARIHVSKLGS